MNKKSWGKINPSTEVKERIWQDVIDKCEAKKYIAWQKMLPLVACLTLIVAAIPFMNRNDDSTNFNLSRSDKGIIVGVEYSDVDFPKMESSLIYLTEDELIDTADCIYEGEIVELYNLKITFEEAGWNRNYIEHVGIAKIRVTDNLKGDLPIGETVDVMLPHPVTLKDIWIEDTEISSQLKEGGTGIFMSYKVGDEHYREEGGKRLYFSDIAEYALGDGERWAFLEKDDNLVFARWAYPTIQEALSLSEARAFLLWKLGEGECPVPFNDGRASYGELIDYENLPISYEQAWITAVEYAEIPNGNSRIHSVSPCSLTYPNAILTSESLQANPKLTEVGYPKDLPIYMVSFFGESDLADYIYVVVDAETGFVLMSYRGTSMYRR